MYAWTFLYEEYLYSYYTCMWIKQHCSHKLWDFAMGFQVRKHFKTFEKLTPRMCWGTGQKKTQHISAFKGLLRVSLQCHVQVNISHNNYYKSLCTRDEGKWLTTKEEADSSLLRDILCSSPGNLHGTSPALYLWVVWFDLQLLGPGIRQINLCYQTLCSLKGLKGLNHE